MPTPHNEAKLGDIAKIVLMPGDPLRAKFIADTFLTDVRQVNSVRNMLMFTGKYLGKEVSVCASGMGMPSMGIYSYELFKFYDVDAIIRIGTAGAYRDDFKLFDTVLVTSSYTDSSAFAHIASGENTHTSHPSPELCERIKQSAAKFNIPLKTGKAHCSEVFYAKRALNKTIKITGADLVEMESAALFINAKAAGKQAACIVSISDNLITHEDASIEERQMAFTNMMKVALGVVA